MYELTIIRFIFHPSDPVNDGSHMFNFVSTTNSAIVNRLVAKTYSYQIGTCTCTCTSGNCTHTPKYCKFYNSGHVHYSFLSLFRAPYKQGRPLFEGVYYSKVSFRAPKQPKSSPFHYFYRHRIAVLSILRLLFEGAYN